MSAPTIVDTKTRRVGHRSIFFFRYPLRPRSTIAHLRVQAIADLAYHLDHVGYEVVTEPEITRNHAGRSLDIGVRVIKNREPDTTCPIPDAIIYRTVCPACGALVVGGESGG